MKNLTDEKFNRLKAAIAEVIDCIGGDLNSEGLKETPDRVAKMYNEVFEGMRYTNKEIAKMYNKSFEITSCNDLVVVSNIPIFSYCEHHLALMYNMKVSVAYLPHNKVIGLSKISRICEMVSKRLQLQERIGTDIAEIMQFVTGSDDVMVVIEGEHSCMTARGVKSNGSVTRTSAVRGVFMDNIDLRKEVYYLIKGE